MVREPELNAHDFIYPLFVRHGSGRSEIRSMPGIYQLSVDEAVREAEAAAKLRVPAVILLRAQRRDSGHPWPRGRFARGMWGRSGRAERHDGWHGRSDPPCTRPKWI